MKSRVGHMKRDRAEDQIQGQNGQQNKRQKTSSSAEGTRNSPQLNARSSSNNSNNTSEGGRFTRVFQTISSACHNSINHMVNFLNLFEYPTIRLYNAVQSNSPYWIERALKSGAGINTPANHIREPGLYPIIVAIRAGNREAIDCLIKKGAIINLHMILWFAPNKLSTEIIDLLIQAGSPMNDLDYWGKSVLHVAAGLKKPEVVSYLLLNDAEEHLNRFDNEGNTPLHIAVNSNDKGAIDALIEAGADVNAVNDSTGMSPLHIAAKSGNRETIRALLKGNPTIEFIEKNGKNKPDADKIALVKEIQKELQTEMQTGLQTNNNDSILSNSQPVLIALPKQKREASLSKVNTAPSDSDKSDEFSILKSDIDDTPNLISLPKRI